MESWRAIPGYVGSYEASDAGRIRSLDRITDRGRRWAGRIMSPSQMANGYLTVTLWRDGIQRSALVHRLVLAAFVGPAPTGMEALHRDGAQTNNSISNLAWGTHSENQMDQVSHGTHPNANKAECPAGHPYDESNTYTYPGRQHRACVECRRNNLRAWKLANPDRYRELAARAQRRYKEKKRMESAK